MAERTINNPVEVDLGGGKLRLVFDMDAMISMEEAGLPVSVLQERMLEKPFTTLRAVIAVGARREHPDLSDSAIGPMLDMRRMSEVAKAVTAALEAQLPPKAENAEKENPPAPPAVQ